MAKVQVICVYSISFSGSTWVNLLQGSRNDALTLGAPTRFWTDYRNNPEMLCRIGGEHCPIWPVFAKRYNPEKNFFLQVAEFTGKSVLVINNPVPQAAQDLLDPDIEEIPMVIVREGRANATSYARNCNATVEEGIHWVAANMKPLYQRAHKHHWPIFQYEAVLEDPNGFLETMGEKIGSPYPPNAQWYWEFDSHHLITANQGTVAILKLHRGLPLPKNPKTEFHRRQYQKIISGEMPQYKDDRWKSDWNDELERLYQKTR